MTDVTVLGIDLANIALTEGFLYNNVLNPHQRGKLGEFNSARSENVSSVLGSASP